MQPTRPARPLALAVELIKAKQRVRPVEQESGHAIFLYALDQAKTMQIGLQHFLRKETLLMGGGSKYVFENWRGYEKFFAMVGECVREFIVGEGQARGHIQMLENYGCVTTMYTVPVHYAVLSESEYVEAVHRAFSTSVLGAVLCEVVFDVVRQGVLPDEQQCIEILGHARSSWDQYEFLDTSDLTAHLPQRLVERKGSFTKQ